MPWPRATFVAWLGCALSLFVSACAPSKVELLELNALDASELEAGDTLYVSGMGFPVGRDGTLALHGQTYRPGQPPLSVVWEAPAHSLSLSLLNCIRLQ